MERLILHCDLNNFYASVEGVLDPSLKNIPIAVCGDPAKRHGVVVAKNELAKQAGVKTGDVVWQARQKSPGLVLVKPHFDQYQMFSDLVFHIYTNYTSQVEPFGADECWLDCTGSVKLLGSGKEIADRIRKEVTEQTGLTASVGVSFNKTFAKLGSDLKKPDATVVIDKQNYRKTLWPLPANEMMMVGKKVYERLKKLNIFTIGDLANASDQLLQSHFGINGSKMKNNAAGLDEEPVKEACFRRKAESIGHGMTATRDIGNYEDASSLIYYLSDRVSARLRRYGFRAQGVAIDLRSIQLKHVTRQCKLSAPIASGTEIALQAIALMKANWKCDYSIRTLTVSAFDLVAMDAATQLCLFDQDQAAKSEKLEQAIDQIKQKYGGEMIVRANLIQQDFIYDKTDAEDFLPFKR